MLRVGLVLLVLGHANAELQFLFPDFGSKQDRKNSAWPDIQNRPAFPTLDSSPVVSFFQSRPSCLHAAPTEPPPPAPPPQAQISNDAKSETDYWTNHVNNILAQGVTGLALHLDRAIDTNYGAPAGELTRDNIVFSPLNLAGTLAVVLLGAAGKTFDEIVNTLGFEIGIDLAQHSEVVHQFFGLLVDSIAAMPQPSRHPASPHIFFAGGVFVQRDYSVRPQFYDIATKVYKNEVMNVDFAKDPQAAQELINRWVNTKTQGKISNILGDSPPEDTKVILASALYFSSEWNQFFFQGGTRRKAFRMASGREVDVDMMYSAGSYPFYEDKQLGVKVLALPYRDPDGKLVDLKTDGTHLFEASMYVLVPTHITLDDLVSKLSPEKIDALIGSMKNETCAIGVPRMKLSSTLSLNQALRSLGLTSLFAHDVANLGLLSSGNSSTQHQDRSPMFSSRFNDEDTTSSAPTNLAGKKNYVRYDDHVGGYDVQQWNSGVYLKKIRRDTRRRRVASRKLAEAGQYSDEQGKGKSRLQKAQRRKRDARPINPDFLRFVEAQGYPSRGLDALRNSPSLPNPGLYASEVLHKVAIDITETGTVAAATTSVLLQRSGNQKRLIANRPFLFFIRHNPSRLMLFWATVNLPTPNYP